MRDKTKVLVEELSLAGIILFAIVLLPMFIGLGKGGFIFAVGANNSTDFNFLLFQYLFYAGPGIGFLIGLLIFMTIETFIKEGDAKYGSSVMLHSPGELPSINTKYFKGFRGMIKLTLISMIIFSILGLYSAYTHQTFTGVGVLKHQFTLFDNLLYSSALVPAAENLGAVFFASLLMVIILRPIARRYKWDSDLFVIFAVILFLIAFASYGYINHQLRYGFNEVALMTVLIFWSVGGLLTILSGSFIPFWIMHIANNLFYELSGNFSNDVILGYTLVGIVVMVSLYVFLFVKKK